nr:MAG TPA: hypothetical protein [Caudoviricetes sp.]
MVLAFLLDEEKARASSVGFLGATLTELLCF